jgi:hypothetical protein
MDQFEIDSDSTSFEPVNLNMARNVAPSFQNTQSTTTNPTNNNAAAAAASPTSWFQKLTSCFTISSLEKHFNIDTIDFRNRIISSVLDANKPNHFREQVLSSPNDGSKQPDLYGPVWITMTLVFFLAVTGNTSKFLKNDAQDVQYDIGHLTKAFFILVFYTFVLPLAIFIMLQCIHVSIGLVEMISIYGYSLVPFIPATVLCLVPSVWMEWLVLFVATVLSLLLVLRNVVTPILRNATTVDGTGTGTGGSTGTVSSSQWSGPLSMCIVVCHFVFLLVIKFVFYQHRFHGGSGSSTSGGGGGGDGGSSDGGGISGNDDLLQDDVIN